MSGDGWDAEKRSIVTRQTRLGYSRELGRHVRGNVALFLLFSLTRADERYFKFDPGKKKKFGWRIDIKIKKITTMSI